MTLSGWVISAALWLGAAPTEPARTAFERAEKALAAGQLDEAARGYQEALRETPRYAEALNGLGSVYFKQGRKPEAVQQFQAAVQADAGFKLGYFNLGYATRKTGDFAAAARAYEKYTALDPKDADGFFGLGESYRQLGQNPAAVQAYQRYVQLETRPTEAKWVAKAREYVTQLQAPRAPPVSGATSSPPAVVSAPMPQGVNPSIAQRLAQADQLNQQGKYPDASAVYDEVLRQSPDNIEALFKMGNVLARQGSYQAAIDRWTRVTQVSRDAPVRQSAQDNINRARSRLATAPIATAPPVKPIAAAPSGVQVSPNRATSRGAYEQGVRQINARDYSGAAESLSNAVTAEPTLTVAYIARGSAYIGLRRFTDAAADYQRALTLDPNRSAALYGLAESYRALGRSAEAKAYYQRYASSTAPDVNPQLQATAREKASGL